MAYRSAKTGRYVTKKYAEKHPSTTVKESKPKKSIGNVYSAKNRKKAIILGA